jgi:PAS domain S-box-containing protein
VAEAAGIEAPEQRLPRSMRLWRWYLAGNAACVALYGVARHHPAVSASLAIGICTGELIAVAVAFRLNQLRRHRVWVLLAAGLIPQTLANVLWHGYPVISGRVTSFPSTADALFLLADSLIVAGLIVLVRTAGRQDRGRLLDAAMIALAFGLRWGVFALDPVLRGASGSSALSKSVAVAYLILDLLLLAVVCRMVVGPLRRSPSFWLLGGAILGQLVGDLMFTVSRTHATVRPGSPILLVFLASYALMGAAALHPSAPAVARPGREAARSFGKWRVPVFALPVILVPGMLLSHSVRMDLHRVILIILGWIAISVVALIRLSGLMVDVQTHRKTQRRLRESEEQLEAILDNATAIVWLKDLDGRYLRINRQFEGLLNVRREQVVGRTDQGFLPDRLAAMVRSNEQEVMASGRTMEFEETAPHEDGTTHTYLSVKFPLRDGTGKIYALGGIATDITERKRMEQEFQQSEERRFSTSVEALVDSFAIFSAIRDDIGQITDFRCEYVNQAGCELNGKSREEHVGHTLLELWPTERVSGLFDDYVRAVETGEPLLSESVPSTEIYGAAHRQGEAFDIRAVKLGDGFVRIWRDVTDRKRAEDAMLRLASIVENSDDAIISRDMEGRIQSWNAGAERLFGYRSQEVVGRMMTILSPPQRPDEIPLLLQRVRRGERIQHLDTVYLRKNGTPVQVSLTVSPIMNAAGRIVGVSTIARDVTAYKRAEEVLRVKGTELARSNAELEQFAYVASHDLQEPLRMVASYVQLLKKRYGGELDADADDFINFAVDGAKRMQALISGLLEYSRVGTHGKPPEPASAEEVLGFALANLRTSIEEAGAEVTHEPLPVVSGDAAQLVELLQNLIGNAIKFRKDDPPKVHLGAKRENGEWVFTVRDNGIGIDPEYSDRIFEVFQRLHTRTEYPGTGIGLAVCKKIVDRHGGRIWVESSPGRGSAFHFTLPAESESEQVDVDTRQTA